MTERTRGVGNTLVGVAFEDLRQYLLEARVAAQWIVNGVNDIWGLDGNGNNFRYFPDGSGFLNYPTLPFATQIATGGNDVWAIDSGQVWHFYNSKGWDTVPVDCSCAVAPIQIASGYGAGVGGEVQGDKLVVRKQPSKRRCLSGLTSACQNDHETAPGGSL